jgi:hypothetical protein
VNAPQDGRERSENVLLVRVCERIKELRGERLTLDESITCEQQPARRLVPDVDKPRRRHGQTSRQFREQGHLSAERDRNCLALREAEDPLAIDEERIAVDARSEECNLAHSKFGKGPFDFSSRALLAPTATRLSYWAPSQVKRRNASAKSAKKRASSAAYNST